MTDYPAPPHARTTGSTTDKDHSKSSNYGRFFAMVGTSTAIMFGLMYLNSYAIEHVYFSETRFYMTFVMGATMAAIMLSFMLGMYKNKAMNVGIYVGSALLFAVALWLVRSQETVQDRSFMRAMIPHHSIAIMTSKRAEVTDPRVKKLTEEIIGAQNREISEMRYLIEDITNNGEVGPDFPLGKAKGEAEVKSLQDALTSPVIAGIRPEAMKDSEVETALGGKADCTFWRAVTADPILATSGNNGVMKVSGDLVTLQGGADGIFATDGASMSVSETGDDNNAKLIFDLKTDPALTVGFDGYWSCS